MGIEKFIVKKGSKETKFYVSDGICKGRVYENFAFDSNEANNIKIDSDDLHDAESESVSYHYENMNESEKNRTLPKFKCDDFNKKKYSNHFTAI